MNCERFYIFSDFNRDSETLNLETAFDWASQPDTQIIAMGDEEFDYLTAMQIMINPINLHSFQKFHDGFWCDRNWKYMILQAYLKGFILCTDPRFLDYMMDHAGDLKWKKNVAEKAHWSQPRLQHRLLDRFL